jgi:hypothetical protein
LKKTNDSCLIWCTEFVSVFKFFSARQVPEIILNEYSRNTENALLAWERDHKVFYEIKVQVVPLKKIFLEFKNIILEEMLSNKLNHIAIFQTYGFLWFRDFFLGYPKKHEIQRFTAKPHVEEDFFERF